jgi:two-component system, sensor histidine kinase LadS
VSVRSFIGGVLAALITFLASAASAEPGRALDLTRLQGGATLRDVTYVLEDTSRALTIEEVSAPGMDARFHASVTDTSFGFTSSAMWVRFDTVNPSDRDRDWLLELPYPHLDHIDLYTQRDDGTFDHIETGDTYPFSERPVDSADFVFAVESAAHSRTRFYLRAQSSGVVRAPLTAWVMRDYLSHQTRLNMALCVFYGAILVMAWYNLCVAALIRKSEHLYFALLLLCCGGGIFTLSGHTFQFLVPDHPAMANQALGFFIAAGLLFVQLYARQLGVRIEPPFKTFAWFRYTIPPSALLIAVALLTPNEIGQRLVFLGVGLYSPIGAVQLAEGARRPMPEMRYTHLGFLVLLLSLPIALIAHAMVLPPFAIALWAGHIGCALYGVIASLAVPARINGMGERVAALNEELSENVTNLKRALAHAEEANEAAQRATKVKDEFMATMSHELRTPLNAIINVPQGLLEDFKELRSAKCSACATRFLLDEGEQVDAQTTCENCQGLGTLVAGTTTKYEGSPEQTARFLRRIERSGQTLLQMVNGVLDYSKMEAGRLALELVELDLGSLLVEAVDELSHVAHTRGIAIELGGHTNAEPSLGDAVRLRQVLRNLLANAIKFSEPNSRISVRWEQDENADLVSIADQGIGIAEENHERIFSSFEQVHKGDTRKYGGTGLGLSISRSLVRMHGGELWVESQLGHGSTFKFRIPRAHGSAGSSLKQPA